MPKVILIRHAKSSWNDPVATDHARVLNSRGRADAPKVAQWLADQGHVPSRILVSDAARTVETAKLMRDVWNTDIDLSFHASLYHAAPDTMLDVLNSASAETIALIGHNPGIALLARGLASNPPNHSRFHDYPTCAATILAFEGPPKPAKGDCVDFVIPREL